METYQQRVTIEHVENGQAKAYAPHVSRYLVKFEAFSPWCEAPTWKPDTLNQGTMVKRALTLLHLDDFTTEGLSEMDAHFAGSVSANLIGSTVEVVRSVPHND